MLLRFPDKTASHSIKRTNNTRRVIVYKPSLLALIFLTVLALPALAEVSRTPRFEKFDDKTTRSEEISCVLQDKQGFVWIGTANGLFRQDGSRSVRYQHDPNDPFSLPSSHVLSLYEDDLGQLWIATNGGLSRLAPETGRFKTFTPKSELNADHELDPAVWLVVGDGKGGMWLGTHQMGLQHFDPHSGNFQPFRHDPSRPDSIALDDVNALALDDKGGLWIATWPGGLDYLAPGASTFRHYRVDPDSHPNTRINNVRGLFFDSKHRLWIANEAGVTVWQSDRDWSQRKQLPSPAGVGEFRTSHVFEDKEKNIWVGSYEQGLLHWDENHQQWVSYKHSAEDPYSLINNNINSITQDRGGMLLLGSMGDGLIKVDPGNKGFERIIPRDVASNQPKLGNYITSIAGDGAGRLWLGGTTGLHLLDPVARKLLKSVYADPGHPGSLSNNHIYSLYRAANGTLWIGTSSGLNRLDPNGRLSLVTFKTTAQNFINEIAPGHSGLLWLATGSGLIRYDPNSGTQTEFNHDPLNPLSYSISSPLNMLEDRNGRVWVGGANMLDVLDPYSGKFAHYRHDPNDPHSLSDNFVNSLYESRDGTVWIATGKGINRAVPKLDGGMEFQQYADTSQAQAIAGEAAGQLWFSNTHGISTLDPATGKISDYPFSDGITEGFWYNVSYRADDVLYFGGANGLTRVDTKAVKISHTIPPVAITEIRILNHSLTSGPQPEGVQLEGAVTAPKSLTLSWQEKVLALEFAAMDYADPSQNKYAYRLDGFDKDWVYTDVTHRVATYTNLSPGDYVFHVKASNSRGDWNETGVSLPITVTPPYWATWWFHTLAAMLVLSLGYFAYRWRIRKLEEDQVHLTRLVAEHSMDALSARDEALHLRDEAMAANQAKSYFLANMSHEIRTPMNTIIGMTQLALRNEHDKKQQDYLKKISQSGEHLLGVIDDILDFSKIDANKLVLENTDFNLDQIKQTLIGMVEWKAAEKGLKLTFDFDTSIPPHLYGDPLRLNQILINYTNNAIKFTEQGEIIVRARKLEETENDMLLRIEVQDSGIGISPAQKNELFQAFHQVDTSTSRKYGGTGLGLIISQRLATLMGGEVGLESEVGKGSTFWATARIEKGSSALSMEIDRREEQGQENRLLIDKTKIKEAHILLADDHLFNQQVATEFLEDAGATVSIANNGVEALDLLHREKFDCVLMDMQMPLMDGLEATQILRADAGLTAIPVIAMTANASNEDRERCLAAGMNDFITKPFKLNSFYATLARWVPAKPNQEPEPHRQPRPVIAPASPTLTGEPELINLAGLADMIGNDPKKVRNFALKFIESAREDIAQIEEAMERTDMIAVSEFGHRAKAAAQMVGATGLADLFQALEDGKNSKNMEQMRNIVNKLRPLLMQIKDQIDGAFA